MKVHLIISIIFKLICYIFGKTIQKGMTESLNPLTSEGDNLDLFSSTYQLQILHQKEVQIVKELEEYVALLHKQIETVKKFLHKKYENEDMSISNVKGKKVRSLGASSFFVVVPKAAMMHEHPKVQ